VNVPAGWTVLRTSHAALLERARASFAELTAPARARRTRIDMRLFGAPGAPLKVVATADGEQVSCARRGPTRARPRPCARCLTPARAARPHGRDPVRVRRPRRGRAFERALLASERAQSPPPTSRR
jgi:hypothetical protein